MIGHRNPDGSANLSGINLPVERVAAASAHIDALAKAAKRAGSTRPVDHLRAELFLGMTEGSYTALDDAAILALLLATGDDTDSTDTDTADTDTDSGVGDAAEAGTGADTGPHHEPDSATADTPGGLSADSAGPATDDPTGNDQDTATGVRGRARGGIELRVRVSTLLGHDQYPGEIAGWGPVHAELTRDLIPTLARGQWRYAITDPRGHLLGAGLTPARPTSGATRAGRTRDIVELQIPATLLDQLARDTTGLGPWTAVITDLARQHATAQADTERFAGDAGRRHPGTALRRHLQIRDRACAGPGCRALARHTDQDHTVDHARGGPTLDWNLGASEGAAWVGHLYAYPRRSPS